MDHLDTNPGVARGLKILVAVVTVGALAALALFVAAVVVVNTV